MNYPTTITALDNPKIKAVVKLRKHKGRREASQFIAQGLREIQRALAAGYEPHQFFYCPQLLDATSLEKLDAWANLGRWFELTPQVFDKIAGIQNPQGILAICNTRHHPLESLDQPRTSAQSAQPQCAPLWLVAVGIEKPGNLGALARSASAAGCAGLLVVDGVVDIYNPNAIRASTGAIFGLPIAVCTSQQAIAYLKEKKTQIYLTTPSAQQTYRQVDWTQPSAIVVGPEDTGLSQDWLDLPSANPITIPMASQIVDSLNASVAAGVVLFEAAAQRRDA